MERVIAENRVVFYRSQLIPCIHGFSTRIGGISTLSHTSSMNLGFDRGDDRETVLENLELFADAVGFSSHELISVSQVHSDNIRRVDRENCGEGISKVERESCDGYISEDESVAVGIRTADCVPILLYAPPKGDFAGAVAALHAGWRGTALGIAGKAVKELYRMGASASDVVAAIGPSIEKCCYSVRDDFYREFLEKAGKELTERYVTPNASEIGVYYADLKGANREILINAGLAPENIDVSDRCTCCDTDEFFSHRYSHGVRGSMLSVIKNKTIGNR